MKLLTNTDRFIAISELRRRFGEIEKALPYVNRFIITKKGKPFAILSADPALKKNKLLEMVGIWKNTELDDDKLWKDVSKHKSRKKIIKW
ncbi:hypothetical protein A2164_03410 [Candidatus Curtissbacteria bacterium RBG_13_35_7]|uniref:Antitoxin n=1 Tax=Candidatus Curtissbacteria bacterium RBG_13_35_7 TaxID=1797705 RepID=A0A1F5G4L9_9BACT|nr:MAG: hypothetical protein A2164_03410 [Candidatus Curtissbacteria bacterium RBG_13_35_7]